MKSVKNIFCLFLILSSFTIFKAQTSSSVLKGEATYLVYTNFGNKDDVSKKIENTDIKQDALNILFSKANAALIVKFDENFVLSTPKTVAEAKTRESFNIPQIVLESMGDFYIDKQNKIIYNKTSFKGKEFLIKQNFDEIKWIITDENKKIGKYNCTKAYTIEKVIKKNGQIEELKRVAWFTDEIPLKFAPLNYYGLPGTVVMLEAQACIFILTDISDKMVSLAYKINPHQAISVEDFLRKQQEYRKNH